MLLFQLFILQLALSVLSVYYITIMREVFCRLQETGHDWKELRERSYMLIRYTVLEESR